MNNSSLFFSENNNFEETNLEEEKLKYVELSVKPKEIVIVIFMMLLWLFSIMRSYIYFEFSVINYNVLTAN